MDDQLYIDNAIITVTRTLARKKKDWTDDAPVFENFEIATELGVTPLQFALLMCRLKLNRLKNRWKATMFSSSTRFASDPDAKDSLKDLACYAVLAMALMEKEERDV